MAEWEYIAVYANAPQSNASYREILEEAERLWIEQLNLRGAEGWELVSEHFHSGPRPGRTGEYWATYNGTMKRSRQS